MVLSKLRTDLVVVSAVLIVGSATLIVAGASKLGSLNRAFAQPDLVHGVTSQTTLLWVRALAAQEDIDADDFATRLVLRLSHLTFPQRQLTALAMNQTQFWVSAIPDFRRRTVLMAAASEAIVTHLAKAPMQGDMWYLAARLRSLSQGFDEASESYIVMSQIYAPKEVAIAASRLELAASQGSGISDQLRNVARNDYQVVITAYPDQRDRFTAALEGTGVVQ